MFSSFEAGVSRYEFDRGDGSGITESVWVHIDGRFRHAEFFGTYEVVTPETIMVLIDDYPDLRLPVYKLDGNFWFCDLDGQSFTAQSPIATALKTLINALPHE